MKVAFYVSGHGLEHATRSIVVMNELMSRYGVELVVVSMAPKSFFLKNVKPCCGSVRVERRKTDAEAVQKSALEVDPEASVAKYAALGREALIVTEQQWLGAEGIDLVVVDLAAVPVRAASLAGIPSVILSNFTWDDIYEAWGAEIDQCRADYKCATLYLQYPGGSPNRHLNPNPLPLLARAARKPRHLVRSELGLVSDRVVLLGFGSRAGWPALPRTPDGWTCLSMPGGDSSRKHALPDDAYIPDFVNAADCVISKLGYGIVSECLSHGTPLFYLQRRKWPEEAYLVKLLGDAGHEIPQADFFNGNWHLDRLDTMRSAIKSNPNFGHLRLETDHPSNFAETDDVRVEPAAIAAETIASLLL